MLAQIDSASSSQQRMPYWISRLGANPSSTDVRKSVVVEQHRRSSAQLDRARTRACHLQTILSELNETFAETRRQQRLPCLVYGHMDRMVRQALTVYERIQLEEEEDEERGGGPSVAPGAASFTAAAGDDIGKRFDDHVGLAQRVRERCRQHSEMLRLAVHRETLYQVMTLKKLEKDLAKVEKQLAKYQRQGDRDEKRLRQMAKDYRASRWHICPVRYFKLKWIIKDAVHDVRLQ